MEVHEPALTLSSAWEITRIVETNPVENKVGKEDTGDGGSRSLQFPQAEHRAALKVAPGLGGQAALADSHRQPPAVLKGQSRLVFPAAQECTYPLTSLPTGSIGF